MNKPERRASLWRRAPLSLFRQPRLAAIVGVVTGVLGFVAATPFLFLSSVSSAAVSRQVQESCRGVGVDPALEEASGHGLLAAVPTSFGTNASPLLGPAIQTKATLTNDFGSVGAKAGSALIVHRTGFADHLVPLSGGGDGVWVPDTLAANLGISLGDTVRVEANEATAPVSAIYRDLFVTRELDSWSCPLESVLGLQSYFTVGVNTPPAVFVPSRDFDRLLTRPSEMVDPANPSAPPAIMNLVHTDYARVEWPFVDLPRTLPGARDAVGALAAVDQAVQGLRASQPELLLKAPSPYSRLPFMADRAGAIRTAVSGAVAPMGFMCLLVALGLAWGLGQFWVDKRQAEVRLLFVRGVAPGRIGLNAAFEMLLPGVLGGVIGWLSAGAAMRALGPSEHFDPGLATRALGVSMLALAGGLVAVMAAVWRRAGRLMEPTATGTATARRLPVPVLWEAAALAGAWWSWRRLSTQGVPVARGDLAPPVDSLALLFPVLFLAGGLGVFGRVLRPVLRMLRLRGRRLPMAPYLAVRRLAAEHATALVLVGVSALAVGVVTYGSGLVRSAETTADAKSSVEAGSDIWVGIVPPPGTLTPPLPGRSTIVGFDSKSTFAGERVSIRVVDPATFVDGAFWDDSFADQPIDELLERLAEHEPDGAIPVLAVGDVPAEGVIARRGNHPFEQAASTVARVDTFPTVGSGEPTLIMASGQIPNYERTLARRVLARDTSAAELQTALTDRGWGVGPIVERNQLRNSSAYLPTIWTFGFVRALGVVVALLAVAALLVYVDTRQRRRAVAAALLARMGVRPWRHWRALLAELGVLTGLSLAIGTALGWFAVRAVNDHLDAAPKLPPGPLLRYPSATTAALVAAGIATVALAASWAQRAAWRTNLGDALREDV